MRSFLGESNWFRLVDLHCYTDTFACSWFRWSPPSLRVLYPAVLLKLSVRIRIPLNLQVVYKLLCSKLASVPKTVFF